MKKFELIYSIPFK